MSQCLGFPAEKIRNKDTETPTEVFRNLLMGELGIKTCAISPRNPGMALLNWSKRQGNGVKKINKSQGGLHDL